MIIGRYGSEDDWEALNGRMRPEHGEKETEEWVRVRVPPTGGPTTDGVGGWTRRRPSHPCRYMWASKKRKISNKTFG